MLLHNMQVPPSTPVFIYPDLVGGRCLTAGHQRPDIDVQHHGRVVLAVGVDQGKIGAGVVLGRDQTQAQRADIVAARQGGLVQDFRPGIDRVAREGWRDVPSAVDGGDVEGVGQAVETEPPGERDDMPAVDQALAEPPA